MLNNNVVVIGASADALSRALVLSRERGRVTVVGSGPPRNAPAAHMHGLSSRDGMPPSELLARNREEIRTYGTDQIDAAASQTAPLRLLTFVMATVAVPIVMYILMPRLHLLGTRLLGPRSES